MAAFLEAQLDFIFFFYGLAFLLLGAVCFAIARGGQPACWAMLGLFGFVHGAAEWLDLTALVVGDDPVFAAIRTTIMAVSFAFLMEFARRVSALTGWKTPGRWIYAPLFLLVVVAGIAEGTSTANVVARYTLGLGGAIATSIVFALWSKKLTSTEMRLALFAAVGFAIYAVAAGAITPTAPLWPATELNHEWFLRSTGIPIQLVRGLLACWIAFSVWAIWGEKRVSDMSSARYASDVRRQFVGIIAALVAILVSGWTLTEYLGEIYKRNVEADSYGELDLLSSRLAAETNSTDAMVRLLAARTLAAGGKIDSRRHMLDVAVEASGSKSGFIMDRSGTIIARSGRGEDIPADVSTSKYFQASLDGQAANHFVFDAEARQTLYLASYPVREHGKVVGVAVLTRSLTDFAQALTHYDRAFFLVDPHGVIALTNRPDMMLRSMWPIPHEVQPERAPQSRRLIGPPLIKREVASAVWTVVNGERNFVRRSYVNHSRWSLVILKQTEEIFASRVLGIAITLLSTILILVYFLGREHRLYETVQMDRRLELQELASDLRFRAHTDPLTGLHNRLRFNEAIALEMARAERYETPLCLVMYDIDHFKTVNDTYGHLAGDKVLIELSHFVDSRIRSSDILARWGGEEFAILLPGSTAQEAQHFAENLRASIAGLTFSEVGSMTCSFGIAQIESEMVVETFIARADEALYRAKKNGRNRVEQGRFAPDKVAAA